jgi:hypothetical protein
MGKAIPGKKWEGQDKFRSKIVNRVICMVARNGRMQTRDPEAVAGRGLVGAGGGLRLRPHGLRYALAAWHSLHYSLMVWALP